MPNVLIRKEKFRETGQRLELYFHKPRNAKNCQYSPEAIRGKEAFSLELLERASPAETLI